jgi:hypothetical protein
MPSPVQRWNARHASGSSASFTCEVGPWHPKCYCSLRSCPRTQLVSFPLPFIFIISEAQHVEGTQMLHGAMSWLKMPMPCKNLSARSSQVASTFACVP